MQSMLKTNDEWFKNGSIKQINEEDEESKRNDTKQSHYEDNMDRELLTSLERDPSQLLKMRGFTKVNQILNNLDVDGEELEII